MQIEETRREVKSIDLLPLINVVFLLILFVLIAGRPSTDQPPAIELAASTADTVHEPTALRIMLDSQNRLSLSAGAFVTASEAAGEIAARLAADGGAVDGASVEILADRRAEADALLRLRRALSRAGIGEIRLKTRLETAEK